MTHKVTVIMDKGGKFLGAINNKNVRSGKDTLVIGPVPHPDHVHHQVEVDEKTMSLPFDACRKALLEKIPRK